ncbi:hypothetical protein ONZ45_g4551 [Pleurotus djamor]|nr:hypothetical protein ONZ45_g4551 [Pleurotus djamor]
MTTSDTNGRCSMRGSCGRRGLFGKPLPCPYDGPPVEQDDESRSLLLSVCGPELVDGPTCCTTDQLETLRDNLNEAEALISACPACRNNFRSFFCKFTCSPQQGDFVNVTSTQTTSSGDTAVKSVDFFVGSSFASGFYDSCKDVQMGAANSYAMDFIGGGAKNYSAFLKFLGDEKDLGSPFQIDYPPDSPTEFVPLDPIPRNCADNDLASRCACIDCPNICAPLSDVPLPDSGPSCHVGLLSCFSFALVLVYALAVAGFLIGYMVQFTIRQRREQSYERVALSGETASPRSHSRGLVGAGSLARYTDGEDSSAMTSETRNLGRGASLLDPVQTVQPRHYPLNTALRRGFYRLGVFATSYPWLVFASVFLAIGLLNVGWKKFEVETDPVRLWVAPDSESKIQKDFFDENFGPFYRTEQIFITSTTSDATQSNASISPASDEVKKPVLSWDTLKYWADVEDDIRSLSSIHDYTLSDVCFKPAGEEGACVVQSVMAWFGNTLEDQDETSWAPQLEHCVRSPVECLPDYQQPLEPAFVLGGVPKFEDGRKDYINAEALVVTYVVSDSLDSEEQAKAMEWEVELRRYLSALSQRAPVEAGLNIAFSTGVSLEEELNKSTNMDVKIVVLSYLAMFCYIVLTLGSNTESQNESGFSSFTRWARNFPKFVSGSPMSSLTIDTAEVPRLLPQLPRKLFVNSKFTLGLFGISLVILSVSSSVGFFSLLNVKVTLIIAEVIPFLVLAVGVDNVYLLVHELDRQNLLHGPNASALQEEHIEGDFTTTMSPTSSHRSPFPSAHEVDSASMPILLSPEERVARALAKIGPSILLSALTETTAFALGALVPMPAVRNFALYAAGSVFLNAVLQVTVFVSALYLDLRRAEASRVDCFPCIRLPSRIALPETGRSNDLGIISRFIRQHYAPFLLRPLVKGIVLALFGGAFVASVISIQYIELGLDQRLALPSESYLVSYFDHLDAYLDIGPPVYFVSRDVDVTKRPGQQALCGRFTTCQDLSVANFLEGERKRPESSYMASPAASWIDDFFRWLDPAQGSCCRVRRNDPSIFCSSREPSRRCRACFEGHEPAWNITMNGFPEGEEFMTYLQQWLISPTDEDCPLAGKASFGTALSLDSDTNSVPASHFRMMHSPLKSQRDFINAFAAAHRIADDISAETGADVFPYSLFYVFFDQYAHVVAITQEILGLGLASVLIITALLLGSWRTGSIVTAVVALTVLNVMGMMTVLGISLNAISLVNLVISLGIAVEFCAHVARAFMNTGSGLPVDHAAGQRERDERMWTALVEVGPSVISGITSTKLIGMSVLALTHSKLLEIYYFRMWLSLIVAGALNGLVLLPVILSLAGGSGFPIQELDEEWMSSAIRNDYGYAPFLADNDSFSSD